MQSVLLFGKEGDEFEKSIATFYWIGLMIKSYRLRPLEQIPKMIRTDKQMMVNSALATGDFFELSPGDKALYCLPTKYIAGNDAGS
jgi:O-succinylbenzoic acid--CoA ligase